MSKKNTVAAVVSTVAAAAVAAATSPVVWLKRAVLRMAEGNHRQAFNRKINGTQWLDGMRPLIVAKYGDTYIILDGNCRFKALVDCQLFPCIVVDHDVSTAAAITEGIAKYKGDTLALSLKEVCAFGLDKIRYNAPRYTAEGGEAKFLEDMISFYEDMRPCPISADTSLMDIAAIKKYNKTLSEYHKGKSALVFRACMLNLVDEYLAMPKGITEALREGYKSFKQTQGRGGDLATCRADGQFIYRKALEEAKTEKKEPAAAAAATTSNGVAAMRAAILDCDVIDSAAKAAIIGMLDLWHDVEKAVRLVADAFPVKK